MRTNMRRCKCGSGLYIYELMDARGIFVAYVCAKCAQKIKGKFRPEIFKDSNYETTEDVD